MPVRIGIPRALFYYYYFPFWAAFFQQLGAEVVLSPPTNKKILNEGVSLAVDEACLPVKVFYGHVAWLAAKVDYIFAPRFVSVETKAYICPKFMGLPDMIRAGIGNLPPLIDMTVDLSRDKRQFKQAVYQAGRFVSPRKNQIETAWRMALNCYHDFIKTKEEGRLPHEAIENPSAGETVAGGGGLHIAVLGHGYNLYDQYVSLNLISKLRRMGVTVTTADVLPSTVVEKGASVLPKRIFWTLGKTTVGGAEHFLSQPQVQGMIHVASFGCGPDSIVADMVERMARRQRKKPFMLLNVDEHSGEAGMNTRLEAFLDMITWRMAK